MMGLVFASCSRPSIVGTWVEPAAEGSLLGEVGFTLLDNGEVVNINTGFREYKTWERNGDLLILHDAGAYGAAMSSNYNSRRYAAETMYTNGELKVVRERQTFEQLLQNDRIIDL